MNPALDRPLCPHTPILPHPHTLLLWVFAALLLAVTPAGASKLTAKEILKKAGRHYDVIKDYVADAKVTVESPSLHVPEMRAKIYYKKPDKLHLESQDGFAVLPREGALVGNPLRELMASPDLTIGPAERVLDSDCHVIKGSFQRENRDVQSTVWIDKKNWLVRQLHGNPEWGPSAKVKIWYARVAGRYWLPAKTVAQLSLPPLPGEEPEAKSEPKQQTIVIVEFTNYRVNIGLDDKIFQEPEGSK